MHYPSFISLATTPQRFRMIHFSRAQESAFLAYNGEALSLGDACNELHTCLSSNVHTEVISNVSTLNVGFQMSINETKNSVLQKFIKSHCALRMYDIKRPEGRIFLCRMFRDIVCIPFPRYSMHIFGPPVSSSQTDKRCSEHSTREYA